MVKLLSLWSRNTIIIIRVYQYLISPLLRANCRFIPTCSNYGIKAINRFGRMRGSWLMIKRIFKCHPLSPGGDDPVPPEPFNTREY